MISNIGVGQKTLAAETYPKDIRTGTLNKQALRTALLFLFTVSGFAGLIYETIWSYYLKLFLGHAAYAQTLVLAIFMGGMAIGAWLSSTYSSRWRNLLRGYAVTEGVIGLLGLGFHSTFEMAINFAYSTVLPSLGSPLTVNVFKWGFSSLLILPQSILLGMTFPLMSAGLIRLSPTSSGSTIAILYFTNSLGAAIGVLLSGFMLIGMVGLPGTILTAAVLNILLAMIVWFLVKPIEYERGTAFFAHASETNLPAQGSFYWLLLGVSLLTGTASFIYEIGWIRMLSLVLGSSTHAFELMLSAFIFGLAFGGLWIRRRIDQIDNPVRYLGVVQVVMGLCAILALTLYRQSFDLMQLGMMALGRTEGGYTIFNLISHLISVMIMFPATFCAGMTLPLITYALLKREFGERSIGSVYAANTLGAIMGVFAATHVGMPVLGLKGLMTAGAALDMALGVMLLWYGREVKDNSLAILGTAVSLGSVVIALFWIQWDPLKMASGVYRYGTLLSPGAAQVVLHEDGKTATVDVLKLNSGLLTIETNGKSDASINMTPQGKPGVDEVTMALTAALPLALFPDAKTVANIGIGSGLTSHVLLGSQTLRQLDTIEIEAAMVTGAKLFGQRVDAVFSDPRSHIYIDDAKTFFSTHNSTYDLIVSEPSNPWVSGVSSLFSAEFYRLISTHLSKHGVLAQWFQLYEVDADLVASVLRALAENFTDFFIYALNDGDMLIVASNGRDLSSPRNEIFSHPQIAKELSRYGIRTASDLELRRIGGNHLFLPLIVHLGVPTNSDYFPFLDLNATRSRFLGHSAKGIVNMGTAPIPVLEMLDGAARTNFEQVTRVQHDSYSKAELARRAAGIRDYYLDAAEASSLKMPNGLMKDVELVRIRLLDCFQKGYSDLWFPALFRMAEAINSYLSPQELARVWTRFELSSCYNKLSPMHKTWLSLFKAVGSRDGIRMAQLSEELLDTKMETNQKRKAYLMVAAMAGYLTQNNPQKALELWRRFASDILNNDSPSLLLRMLFAHSVRTL